MDQRLAWLREIRYPAPIPGRQENTHVSIFYVLHWALHECLRELTQNMIDEIINSARQRGLDPRPGKQLSVRAVAGSQTDFEWYGHPPGQPPVLLGSITYNAVYEKLSFRNLGAIPVSALLLGGGTKTTAPPDNLIAGRFGEGLKLAILCALRERKTVSIKTGGQQWIYSLRTAPFFAMCDGGRGEPTLHYEVVPDPQQEPGWVVIELGMIKREEWLGTPQNNTGVHCFLQLREAIGEQLYFVHPLNFPEPQPAVLVNTPQKPRHVGSLLLGDHVKGKIFVKGIFVCHPAPQTETELSFGYNFDNLELDRDRNSTVNQVELNKMTSNTIGHILEFRSQISPLYAILDIKLPEIVNTILSKLSQATGEVYYLHWYHDKGRGRNTCDLLLNAFWEQRRDKIGPRKADWEMTMPVHVMSRWEAELQRRGLPLSVYPMIEVSWALDANLNKSSHFRTIDQKLAEFPQGPIHVLTPQEQEILNNVKQKFAAVLPGIMSGQIPIVFLANNSYTQNYKINGTIYLSKQHLDPAIVRNYIQLNQPPAKLCEISIESVIATLQNISVTSLLSL